MERIPCIKCTPALWEYIKPYLEKWGYTFGSVGIFEKYQLLVINYNGGKMCTNVHISEQFDYNRELVTDVEEFLERAAKLKGFTYKRKDMKEFTKADLKSGMIVKLNNNQYYLVVDNILIGVYGQMPLADYDENLYLKDKYHKSEYSIKEVYQKKYRTWGMGFNDSIENNLVLLWQRENVEYTMQEIADKLGIPVEQLRIKK